MKIKNISGTAKLFSLGRRSVTLAANQVVSLDDEPTVVREVARRVKEGSLQLIEAPADHLGLYSQITPTSFAFKPGALLRWADGDTLNLCGVIFEVDTNATYTAGRIPVTTSLADLANLEAAFHTSFGASAVALADAGIAYVGKQTLGAVTTYVFSLDIDVTAVSAFVGTPTNAGGSGTAPSVIKPADLSVINPQQVTVDAVVPAGATRLALALPCTRILGTPVVSVVDGAGADVTYTQAPTISGNTIELTSLTAGHVATIIAVVR